MSNAYIHYVKRKIVVRYPKDIASPWFSELQSYESGFNKPVYHVTRSKSWPAKDIKEGDVIWLVGKLSSPWGLLPPSIDARIEVKSVDIIKEGNNQTKYRFLAGPNSRWLPLHDATIMLNKLQIILKNGEKSTPCNPDASNVGQVFQSIRKLNSPYLIEKFALKVESLPHHFISYRIVDGTKMAFEKANSLVKNGNIVFWDRWSLPRRLAERRELVADAALDGLLNKKITDSSIVWGIESPKYNETNSYSAKEKALAVSLGKYRVEFENES